MESDSKLERILSTKKSVYLIIGVNIEGKKEILDFWIAKHESSKQ